MVPVVTGNAAAVSRLEVTRSTKKSFRSQRLAERVTNLTVRMALSVFSEGDGSGGAERRSPQGGGVLYARPTVILWRDSGGYLIW
ncbi:hypothetical protein OWV82_010488 [Melia azedarach]|uniref:Uncharacterized protein n=1 Tax=Melia azedarach TaxID=155640 RepID=A0ACC1Y555_MELAZ|nr:hypothetical protein OWV82_010488 [Melia azedarach]